MSVNLVQIIGRAGKDPEFKQVSDTFTTAKIPVAVSEKYKDKNGEKVEKTEWVNCVGFNHIATLMNNYIKKGDLVYFAGKLQTRSWESEGKKHYATEVVVNTIDFLTPKGSQQQDPLPPSDIQASAPVDDSNLPF